ncbi:hypothetical protein K4F52_000650 [Lecanicillium sp. MT-2017a]|nr:hypothetical protein K4F52_000650 [Lecanicillium sp. MT-2017a]
MHLSIGVVAAIAPFLGVAQGLVGVNWNFPNDKSGGLNDVTFGFNMANAEHESGYYYAQQFNFDGVKDVGYTGVQPRADKNGKSIVHAVFSSFVAGTKSTSATCHDGADGGAGVSCALDFEGDYSHTYNNVIENVGGTTWRGTIVDTVTGTSRVIGEWTLPSGAGAMKTHQLGFVEYYPWNAQPSHSCASLPKTQVAFYNPTSKTSGAGQGKVSKPYEYGDCKGEVAFSTSNISGGVTCQVGF